MKHSKRPNDGVNKKKRWLVYLDQFWTTAAQLIKTDDNKWQ